MDTPNMSRRDALKFLGVGAVGIAGVGALGKTTRAFSRTASALGTTSNAAKKTTLTFWNQSTGQDLADFCIAGTNFAKFAGNVEVTCTGYSDISKLEAAIAAGTPPDLAQVSSVGVAPGLFADGALIELNSYMRDSHFDTSAILPGALPYGAYEGKYFALPFMAYSVTDFFWNKKLFAKKGLDPNTPPKTLEELKTYGEKFDVYKHGKLVQVGFNPISYMAPESWCLAFGASFYDSAKKEITPNDPGVIKGLEWLQSYADKYGASELTRLETGYGLYESAQNPLLSGAVAMTAFWDALVAYRDRYAPSVELGFAPFPYPASMPQQKGWGELQFNQLVIPKGVANPDLCWKFLEYVENNLNTNIQIATLLANTPQNVKALRSPHNSAPPLLKEVQEYASGPKQVSFPPPIPVASQYYNSWAEQTQLIWAGKVSIEKGMDTVLNTVQPQLEKALKR